ncbi:MAG: cobalt-precorrin-6A reductase [Rhizobiaceae bacterium]|nr:cobalt-precorrin-6A reductase [Rhizobiaceae bacterium]
MTRPVLILGGTAEARRLAGILASHPELDVTLSLAGRTLNPAGQGVPVRSGGFGGVEGLAAWLRDHDVALVIDATHPYAARMSANAAETARQTGIPLLALRRPAWQPVAGDRWTEVGDVSEAVRALGDQPRRVFLALGRKELLPFEAAPQHHYLIRSVDPVEPPLLVPDAEYIRARGPFDRAAEQDMLARHRINAIVCKNSGGDATYGKIEAARDLGIEVVMLRRPLLPDVPGAVGVDRLVRLALHHLGLAERGE